MKSFRHFPCSFCPQSLARDAMDNPVDRMIRLMTLGAGLVGILVYTVLELL